MDHKARAALQALVIAWAALSLPARAVEIETPLEGPAGVAEPSQPGASLTLPGQAELGQEPAVPELSQPDAGLPAALPAAAEAEPPAAAPAANALPEGRRDGWLPLAAPAANALPEGRRDGSLPLAVWAPAQAQAVAAERLAGYAKLIQNLDGAKLSELSGEQAKDLSNRFIDPSEDGPAASGGAAVPVEGAAGALPALSAHTASEPSKARVPKTSPLEKPASLRQRLKERLFYSQLYAAHLYFYIVENIRMKWPPFYADWKKLKASGQRPPISRPRDFFSYMRVMGQTGSFYVLGFTARWDAPVVREAKDTFRKYFDAPGIGPRERAAFDAFLERARNYNSARRAPSNFRKLVRDTMLKAATMPVSQLADYFDSRYRDQAKTSDFQSSGAVETLKRFEQIVDEELRKEPKDAKDRVVGVVLIGSFATGSATPTSDFDGEPVTADGTAGRSNAFVARVLARWKAEGRQATNPVTFHEHPLPFSRRVVRMVHDCPYLVLSPDPAVVSELAMRAGQGPVFWPSRELTRKGIALRWLQYAGVYASTFLPPKK